MKKNKENYQQFFDNPLNGFALCEIITNDKGEPEDFVYLEVNKTFENLTGLKKENVLNKKVTEILPYEDVGDLIQIYGKVALTGESTVFQYPIPSLDKYYEIAAFSPQKKRFIAFFTDITERKKAEEELMMSEERYRGVVQNTTAVILRLNPQGIIQFANERALEFFGYSADELVGKHVVGTIVPEKDTAGRDLAAMVDEITKNPDGFHSNENENIRKNGERVWMEWTNSGIYDQYGHMKEFLAVGIDTTERKKAEEELREARDNLELKVKERTRELQEAYKSLSENEEKFREIFNKANDMITLVELGENGLPGRFLEVNDVATERLGYSKEEFLKMNTADIVDPKCRPQMVENAKNVIKNRHIRFEILNVDKWGSKIPVEVSIHIFKLRGKNVILAISRDIRERKQAEKQLKESADEIYDLYNNAPCGYHSLDANGNFSQVNQTELSWLGYKKEELIGRNFSELLTKESQKAFKKNFRSFLERGYVKDLEYELIRKDGSTFPIILSASTLKDEKGNFLLSKSILFDITEIKKAQDELQRSKESYRTLAENSPESHYPFR